MLSKSKGLKLEMISSRTWLGKSIVYFLKEIKETKNINIHVHSLSSVVCIASGNSDHVFFIRCDYMTAAGHGFENKLNDWHVLCTCHWP